MIKTVNPDQQKKF